MRSGLSRIFYVSRRCLVPDQIAEISPDNFLGRFVEELGAGSVDTRNITVHVAGVNDIGGVFDDPTIMPLYAPAFRQSGNLYQQLFIAKRNLEIIVGAGSQPLETIFH